MATLAMRADPILPSPRDMFREQDSFQQIPSRSGLQVSQTERIELPSIRQAVPEIQQSARPEPEYRLDSVKHSPTAISRILIPPPEHIRSPARQKRRRISNDDDQDLEPRQSAIPRRYNSPTRPYSTHSATISPTGGARRSSATADSWSSSARNSPYISARGFSRPRSPPPADKRSEWRPMLPSLPSLTFDRGVQQTQRPWDHWSEYSLDSTRVGAQTYPPISNSSFDPPISAYHSSSFSYGYQQPRGQSYSGPSSNRPLSHDRTPFPNSHQPGYPGGNFPYALDMSEIGDSKQRKRRGNLPKETTDKLRAWFVAHLQHPYPTEGEKQDLMGQTGLQMNQISNWFINARRRQLPTMINNARAESDARSARGEGLHGEDTSDYGEDGEKRTSPPGDSEGEVSPYDGEYKMATRHMMQGRSKRESI